MAWRLVNSPKVRRIFFIITIILGLAAAIYSYNDTKQSALEHDQHQQIIVYDMSVLLENQKRMAQALNESVALHVLKSKLAYSYDEIPVNPQTGQP